MGLQSILLITKTRSLVSAHVYAMEVSKIEVPLYSEITIFFQKSGFVSSLKILFSECAKNQ